MFLSGDILRLVLNCYTQTDCFTPLRLLPCNFQRTIRCSAHPSGLGHSPVPKPQTLDLSYIFGGYKVEDRPDPIPNSDVKLNIADGSACKACARVGSRRSFLNPLSLKTGGFFLSAQDELGTQSYTDRHRLFSRSGVSPLIGPFKYKRAGASSRFGPAASASG